MLALTVSEGRGEDVVPFWDMVPGVSQIKSIAQLISGDVDGSLKTAVNFLHDGFGTSQLRSTYFLATGDVDKAVETQKKFGRNIEVLVDSTPVLGHVKGIVHLLNGDEKHGWSVIRQATSTALSAVGGVVAGPAGFVAGQAAVDGLTTLVDLAVNDNAEPHGIIDYVLTAKNRTVAEHVDALASIAVSGPVGSEEHAKKEDREPVVYLAVLRPLGSNKTSDGPTVEH